MKLTKFLKTRAGLRDSIMESVNVMLFAAVEEVVVLTIKLEYDFKN